MASGSSEGDSRSAVYESSLRNNSSSSFGSNEPLSEHSAPSSPIHGQVPPVNDGSPDLNNPDQQNSGSLLSSISFGQTSGMGSSIIDHSPQQQPLYPSHGSSGFKTAAQSGGSDVATAGENSMSSGEGALSPSNPNLSSNSDSLVDVIGLPQGASSPNVVSPPDNNSNSPQGSFSELSSIPKEQESSQDLSRSVIVLGGSSYELSANSWPRRYHLNNYPPPHESEAKLVHVWQNSRLIGMPHSWYFGFEQILEMQRAPPPSPIRNNMTDFDTFYRGGSQQFVSAMLYAVRMDRYNFQPVTILERVLESHFLRDICHTSDNDDGRTCIDLDVSLTLRERFHSIFSTFYECFISLQRVPTLLARRLVNVLLCSK